MVFIKGKSGSGKSTIINMISLLDSPTSGSILYNGKNILSYSEKEITAYHKNEVGIVFQSYHLLEYESVLYNVELPLLIDNVANAEDIAKSYLEKVQIDPQLYNHKAQDLSGGEKQRIALIRALIKNPAFLVCDEPTGAVDSINSSIIMDLLKEESKSKLVIVVSHNDRLIDEYADQILTIDEGLLVDTQVINDVCPQRPSESHPKNTKKGKFINHLAFSNFKRRKKQSIFNSVVMSICLLFSVLIIGFISNIDNLVTTQAANALDYGALTLSCVQTESVNNSNLSLVKSYRPRQSELSAFLNQYQSSGYKCDYNLDYFISGGSLTKERVSLFELTLQPVYEFSSKCINTSLLYMGSIPNSISFDNVLINTSAYNYLKTELGIEPLNMTFSYYLESEISYVDESTSEHIVDTYLLDHTFHIVGVVDDFSFLSSPMVYYSYRGFSNYLSSTYMDNLSAYLGEDISYYDFLGLVSDNSVYTMYSYRLFLSDFNNYPKIEEDIASLPSNYSLTSTATSRVEAFASLLDAVRIGLIFFLAIVIIISLILLGIICLSSYISDSKGLAILLSLGMKRNDSINMYVTENVISLSISLGLSFILSFIFQWLINFILKWSIGISPFIQIPFLSFLGIPLGLPIIVIIVSLFALVFSSSIPLMFKGKISLKEELQTNG